MTRKPSSMNKGAKEPPIDTQVVRELAAIMRDTGLAEIEVEVGEMRLRLARPGAGAPAMVAAAPAPALLPAPTYYAQEAPPPVPSPSAPPGHGGHAAAHPGAVTSPLVGTAYLSPEPGAPAFVKVGDTVTEGQTILVVEAMKTFNPIPAPRAGKVTAILVTDAQPVEFGAPLLILE